MSVKQMTQWKEREDLASDQVHERAVESNACSHAVTQKETWLTQGYCLRGDGMLDLSVASEAIKAITKRNTGISALLRLPSEIRDRIYEFALAGYRISIYEAVLRSEKYREVHGPTFEHWALAAVSAPAVEPGSVVHGIEHWRFQDGMNPGRLPHLLGMLRTCRQIYEGAALLIYQLNILHLPKASGAEYWLQCRKMVQKSVITRLDLSHTPEHDISYDVLAEELPNLKVLFFRYVENVKTVREKENIESRNNYWCSKGVSVVEYCRIVCSDDHSHKHMEAGPCWCRKHEFISKLRPDS